MLRLLLIFALVGFIGLSLYRLRESRRGWVTRLRLAGRWTTELGGVRYLLELQGGPSDGEYSETTIAEEDAHGAALPATEHGRWQLRGHTLRFTANDGHEDSCDLRLFGDGSLGVHGDRRQGRVYRRAAANVVPMRRAP